MIHLFRPWDRSTVPAGSESYAPAMHAAWMRAFPKAKPESRDKEDWVENACFLEAFERLGVEYQIVDTAPSGSVSSMADFALNGKGPDAFFHTGISSRDQLTTHDFCFPYQGSKLIDLSTGYAKSKTFRDVAGRRLIACRLDPGDIDEAIKTIAPNGGQVFVKTIRKQNAMVITYDEASKKSPASQLYNQIEDIMWDTVRFEGSEQPYLVVQDVIRPAYEYRMFMVDGKPVTGAGCIEEFTPLDNWETFDPKMARIRNQSGVESCRNILDDYLEFAHTFGASFAAENGDKLVYSLDLCVDLNASKIVPIEINPPANLGRYASDTDAWVKAVDALSN